MKEDSRPRFKAICPNCGTELWVCKSMAMEMGILDMGHGGCYVCKEFLHLEFDEEKQIMKATIWDDYIKCERMSIQPCGDGKACEGCSLNLDGWGLSLCEIYSVVQTIKKEIKNYESN